MATSMKASELRIGNYFLNSLGEITILPFGSWLETNYVQGGQPIPITEEWLIKFGFKNGKIHLPTFCYLEVASDGSIAFTDNESIGASTAYLATNKTPIQYVHQLQNLYFALTGEELTIK